MTTTQARGEALPFSLREATPADLDALLRLELAVFPEDPWTAFMLAEELASPSSRYWVAEAVPEVVDGQESARDVIGYAGVKIAGDQADVMTIGVLPASRGLGAGQRLMETLVAWAAGRGAREIFLEVRPSNRNAIRLYERCGFSEIGRRPRYFRNPIEEAVEMRAPLNKGDETSITK